MQSQANNNATLNLNISNYPGSSVLANNENVNVNGFLRHQPTFQSSVESLKGIADGFGEKEKADEADQRARAENSRQEMNS